MGKNGHRKLRQRQISDDINNNSKSQNGHSHPNGKRDNNRNGHRTKCGSESTLHGESRFGILLKCIGYSLVLVLFFTLFFHTQLETFLEVLNKSADKHSDSTYKDSENSKDTAAFHKYDSQLANKLPGKVYDQLSMLPHGSLNIGEGGFEIITPKYLSCHEDD